MLLKEDEPHIMERAEIGGKPMSQQCMSLLQSQQSIFQQLVVLAGDDSSGSSSDEEDTADDGEFRDRAISLAPIPEGETENTVNLTPPSPPKVAAKRYPSSATEAAESSDSRADSPALPAHLPLRPFNEETPRAGFAMKRQQPTSAYNCFFQEERQRLLKQATPTGLCGQDRLSLSEIHETIGKKWKELPMAARVRYHEQAAMRIRKFKQQVQQESRNGRPIQKLPLFRR